MEGDVILRGVHAADQHAGDLGCDLVVGDAVGDFVVQVVWEEVEEVVVDAVEILAVLPGVVEALLGDLGELAAAVEAGLCEWVC